MITSKKKKKLRINYTSRMIIRTTILKTYMVKKKGNVWVMRYNYTVQ